MQKADAFEAHLAQAKKTGPHPLYVLSGDEPLLVMELQDQLRSMVIAHGHTCLLYTSPSPRDRG